jgi:hypothetical protein
MKHLLPASLLLLVLLATSPALAQHEKNKKPEPKPEFARAGAALQIPLTGTGTFSIAQNEATSEPELDDAGGLGVRLHGVFHLFQGISGGLALAYLNNLTYADADRNNFAVGSQTDLSLELDYRAPVTGFNLDLHLAGGLSLLSTDDKQGQAPDTQTADLYDTARYDTDNTSALGYHLLLGTRVGYELIPLVNFFLGLDFQFSFVQPFAGEASNPVPPLDEDKLTVDLSSNRLTLTVGVEFDL